MAASRPSFASRATPRFDYAGGHGSEPTEVGFALLLPCLAVRCLHDGGVALRTRAACIDARLAEPRTAGVTFDPGGVVGSAFRGPGFFRILPRRLGGAGSHGRRSPCGSR